MSCARQASAPAFGWHRPRPRKGGSRPTTCCAPRSAERDRGERADGLYERLLLGRFKDQAERLDLERELVAGLNEGCERGVIAYRLRREVFSDDFSNGIENIAVDFAMGLQRAHRRSHRQAQGLPLERLAARRHRGRGQGRLEPGRRLHRRGGPPGVGDGGRRCLSARHLQQPLGAEPRRGRPRRRGAQAEPVDPRARGCPDAAGGDRQACTRGGGQGRDGQARLSRLGLGLPGRHRDGAGRSPLPLRAGLPLGRGRAGPADLRSPHRCGDPAAARPSRGRAGAARRRARAGDRRPHLSLSQPGRRGAPQQPVGRRGRECADRPAVELGALARAGADGGRGRTQHRRLLRGRGGAPRHPLARPGARQGAARAPVGPDRGARQRAAIALPPSRAWSAPRRRRRAGRRSTSSCRRTATCS